MPRIQVITLDGQPFHCDSSDPETIGTWFAETLHRIYPDGQISMSNNELRILAYPLFNGDKPDWTADSRYLQQFSVVGNNPAELVLDLIVYLVRLFNLSEHQVANAVHEVSHERL